MHRVLGCMLVTGCSFSGPKLSGNSPADAADAPRVIDAPGQLTDAGHDAMLDAAMLPAGCFGSRGSGSFYICDPYGAPTGPLTLATTATDYNTNACSMGHRVMLGGQTVCLIDGAGVTITNFSVIGDNVPLVIASSADITVIGTLDASTSSGGHHGPGANGTTLPGCAGNGLNGADDNNGAGGGAGGSLGSLGGAGGNGKGGNGPGAVATTAPTTLHAGCGGGSGGNGNGNNGGNPGWGGGAVWLVAYGSIMVTGTINVSGERGYPGNGGSNNGGGGGSGGGSGGMIVFDAATLMVTGTLIANGGGGGGGGDGNGAGNQGNDPTLPAAQADGGPGNNSAGNGGKGAAAAAAATKGANTNQTDCGGGGGGGGLGIIEVISGGVPIHATSISPDAKAAP